ncbi:monooxygenase [Thermoascus aurantiacus ATCC 26904]
MMLFSLLASSALVLGTSTAAAPSNGTTNVCTDPVTRQEWRQLSPQQRDSYIKAVQCLATRPSRLGLSTTLYDDFAYVHNQLNDEVHSVASFLPWHRYFVHVDEQALRECGYEGSTTYWDWTLDSSDPSHSPIWDPETGFGGNGSPRQYTGSGRRPHCLGRDFNNGTDQVGDMLGYAYTPKAIAEINALDDYDSFRVKLEGRPHGAIHSAIGGIWCLGRRRTVHPIFFLHHTQIDRLWWLWQQEKPDTRNTDYGGFKTQDQLDGTTSPPASLDDILPMRGLADDRPVRELMLTESELLATGISWFS